jgi:glycosyltransferase involved in cell wall biosynthesis
MRLVMMVSSLGSGGAERVASSLCSALAERGDSVRLVPTFSGRGTAFYPLHSSVDLQFLADRVATRGERGKNQLGRLMALRSLCREFAPDVVVSFLTNVNVAAVLSTRFLGVPCVISERIDPAMMPTSRMWRLACRMVYPFADTVVVQTPGIARSVAGLYPGLRQVCVIPNPLPVGLDAHHHRGRSTHDGRKVMLSMGRLSAQKRVDHIVAAFARIAVHCPEWDLHIWGEGELRRALEQQVEACGLAHRIALFGRTGDPWAVMADADAFVMASEFEGFPNALLEAMGVGLPCISTDCRSGPADLAEGGRVARLVPVGDVTALAQAMEGMMNDGQARADLGTAARRSVRERFGLEAILTAWDRAFLRLGVKA